MSPKDERSRPVPMNRLSRTHCESFWHLHLLNLAQEFFAVLQIYDATPSD